MIKVVSAKIVVLVFASLVFASISYAQCPEHAKMETAKGMSSQMMSGCTPEQEKAMMDLKMTLIKETDPLKTNLKIKEMELQALWKQENPDAKKIIDKVKEINGLKGDLEVKMVNHRLAMYKICTPEQRKMMEMMGMSGAGCMMGGCGMMGSAGKTDMGGCMGQGMGSCPGK